MDDQKIRTHVISAGSPLEQFALLHQVISEMCRGEVLYTAGQVTQAELTELNQACVASIIVSLLSMAHSQGFFDGVQTEITKTLATLSGSLKNTVKTDTVH